MTDEAKTACAREAEALLAAVRTGYEAGTGHVLPVEPKMARVAVEQECRKRREAGAELATHDILLRRLRDYAVSRHGTRHHSACQWCEMIRAADDALAPKSAPPPVPNDLLREREADPCCAHEAETGETCRICRPKRKEPAP